MFDGDNAGINAALRAALILIENGLYVKVAALPGGLDPDDFINKNGVDNFKKEVENAKDIIDFQADILLKGYAALGPQDKTNIAGRLMETILKQPDEIIKREWAKTVADRLDIDAYVILAKVSAAKPARQAIKPQVKETYKEPADNTPRFELDLVKVLLKFPRYVEMCKDLQSRHFKNQKMWSILKGIEKIRTENPTIENVAALLTEQMPQEEQIILKLSVDDMPKDMKPSKDIEVYLKALEKAAIAEDLKKLQQKTKEFQAGSVPLDLLKRQIELQKKLKN
jgi:DNA primase